MKESNSLSVPTRELMKIEKLFIYFMIYSFIGWLLETSYAFYIHGEFVNRGFLYGPICPLYGFGSVILIVILSRFESNSIKLFLMAAVVFSIFEYVAGYGLEAIFNARWWDYTDDFLNLNGRISLMFSFVWGIISIMFINHIHPFISKHTKKAVYKLPISILIILIRLFFIYCIVDMVFSSIGYII